MFMKLYLFIRKHITSPLFSYIEKATHPSLVEQGGRELKELKSKCTSITDYVHFINRMNFKWSNDPIWGILDYTSCPEMTVAGRGGDCDDFAALAIEVLKPHFEKSWLLYTLKGIHKAHVMALFFNGFRYQLLSNGEKIFETENEDELFERCAEAYYGTRIQHFLVEEIK